MSTTAGDMAALHAASQLRKDHAVVIEVFTTLAGDALQQLYRIANALERMANAAESQGAPDLAAMSASIFGGLGDALAAAQQEGPTEDG